MLRMAERVGRFVHVGRKSGAARLMSNLLIELDGRSRVAAFVATENRRAHRPSAAIVQIAQAAWRPQPGVQSAHQPPAPFLAPARASLPRLKRAARRRCLSRPREGARA